MFIKLSNYIINTDKIITFNEDTLTVDGDRTLPLSDDDYNLLSDYLLYIETPSVIISKDGGEMGKFVTELHKLVGGRGDAKLTTDRKARLNTRLKDFSKEDLKRAAYNLGQDEFMQGANDNGKRYGTIDYLLRTSANVNKWLEEEPKKRSLF